MNKIYTNTTPQISFNGRVVMKRASLFNPRRICNFDVDHSKYDHLEIKSKRNTHCKSKNEMTTTVNSPSMGVLAYENYSIKPKEKEMYASYILTNERYRNNSLGEILRLSSIVTMLENKLKKIRIFSSCEAVIFHTKCKFEPNISEAPEALRTLREIARSKSEEFSRQAKALLAKVDHRQINNEQLFKSTNKLTKGFLHDTIKRKNYTPTTFDRWYIDMVLTEENVLKHKDHFNQLFQKHGIEYTIN